MLSMKIYSNSFSKIEKKNIVETVKGYVFSTHRHQSKNFEGSFCAHFIFQLAHAR